MPYIIFDVKTKSVFYFDKLEIFRVNGVVMGVMKNFYLSSTVRQIFNEINKMNNSFTADVVSVYSTTLRRRNNIIMSAP